MHASITVSICKLQLCALKQNNGSIGYRLHKRLSNTMSICTAWMCARSTLIINASGMHAQAKVAISSRLTCLFLRFHYYRSAILWYRWELSREKVVCCGKLTLHWTHMHTQTRAHKHTHTHTHTHNNNNNNTYNNCMPPGL